MSGPVATILLAQRDAAERNARVGKLWRLAFIFALTFTLVASLRPAAGAEDDDLIVPGVRVGAVHLGITDRELYILLGEPNGLTNRPGSQSYLYVHRGLYVNVDSFTHRVFEIDVAKGDNKFHTAEGIKVGMPASALRTRLAYAHENRPPEPGGFVRVDYEAGLTLIFMPDKTLYKIEIWAPGGPHF
jgi:hypothetical protein